MTPRTAFLACLTIGTLALAHKGSDAYVTLSARGTVVSGRIDLSLRDLDPWLDLDRNRDANITWGEVRQQERAVCSAVQEGFSLSQQGTACAVSCGQLGIKKHSDGPYASLALEARCPLEVDALEVRYELLFNVDAQHRGLVSVRDGEEAQWAAFTNNQRHKTLTFESIGDLGQFNRAFALGIHHIALGWDHLCFLLALLLPSVLRRTGAPATWEPREAFRQTLVDVTKVVTAFTIAHSLTLALAAFGMVVPDAFRVEVAIALSVALAAFNNLFPFVPEARWSLAFSLGLLHGLGFVSAIADLGASGATLWLSVLGFNLGVELGQLVIVAGLLPLAWSVRKKRLYRSLLLPLGSAIILGVAMYWTTDRLGVTTSSVQGLAAGAPDR